MFYLLVSIVFLLHVAIEKSELCHIIYTSDGRKLVTHNTRGNTGTPQNPMPTPESPGTVFWGYGYGWPKKTPGPSVQNTTVAYPLAVSLVPPTLACANAGKYDIDGIN